MKMKRDKMFDFRKLAVFHREHIPIENINKSVIQTFLVRIYKYLET